MWGTLEIRTMLKQGVIIVVHKPMKSRNTAPRLGIDLGPGCFPQLNKSDIPPQECRLSGWQVSSFQPPYPAPRLCPFLARASSSTPVPPRAVLAALPTHAGYREDSSCEVGGWPRVDALSSNWGQFPPEKGVRLCRIRDFRGSKGDAVDRAIEI